MIRERQSMGGIVDRLLFYKMIHHGQLHHGKRDRVKVPLKKFKTDFLSLRKRGYKSSLERVHTT